jgi:Tfp pilus assembly protein PilX
MSRLRSDESGFAMIAVIMVLMIVTLLTGAALALSLRSVTTSSADRARDVALGAADEGADVAAWRMNKLLVSPGGAGLMGFADGLLGSLGCINVNANLTLSVAEIASGSVSGGAGAGWCAATPPEDAGNGATFSYRVQTDVNLNNVDNLNIVNGGVTVAVIVERRILVTGTDQGQVRRLLLTYRLDPQLTPLFERYRYVECSPVVPAGSTAVDAGCPDPGH